MSAGDSVFAEQDRVVRLFGESIERLRDPPAPSNDVRGQPVVAPCADDLRARLGPDVERTLRAPFSEIASAARALVDEATAAQAAPLAAITEAAARGDAMVVDLLRFVRLCLGGVPPARRRVDLKVVCERVVDAVSTAHPDRPMILTSDRRVDGDWDADGIETMLSKLLLNAIEHGAARPPIRIGLRSLGEAAILEVWNAGAIADAHVRAKLFEPFTPGHSMSPRGGGLGLGLYLVRAIAQAHGGWVDVQSDDRQGTTFQVVLPRS